MESGFVWEPESESSHHRSGVLWLSGRLDGEPLPLIDGPSDSIELELKGLAAASRTFSWTPEELVSVAVGKMTEGEE